MPRDLFGDVVDPGRGLGAHARSAVPLSLAGHVILAAVVIIVPLMATGDLPRPYSRQTEWVEVERRVPQLPPQSPRTAARTSTAVRSDASPSTVVNTAPSVAPTNILPESATTASVGTPGEPVGGLEPGDLVGSSAAPRPPEIRPAVPSGPVRPGGVIKTPVKVRHVPPVYPAIALQARVEGMVIIDAIVGVDGRVVEARVVRSQPLLDEAALTAVRQWRFTPTTLNGVPVPVIMTVTVNFTLR